MVVRMRLPTESEPAMTLEKVHAAGALFMYKFVKLFSPWKLYGVC